MGGTSSSNQTQVQQQTTDPYAPTKPILNQLFANLGQINPNLTGAETGAINELGQTSNQNAGQIGQVATDLLAGGGATGQGGFLTDAFNKYRGALDPFASGQYVDPANNPGLQKYLQVARDDATRGVNDMFAGAGRDLSGAHMQAYGRGVGQAEAPILYDAYNQARNQQLGAIQGQFGGAGMTAGALGDMNAQGNQNKLAGIGAADAATAARSSAPMAMLQAEAMRRGLPLQTMAQIMGLTLPAAGGLGSTTNWGNTQGEQTKSAADTFNTWASGFSKLFGGGTGSSMGNASKLAGF